MNKIVILTQSDQNYLIVIPFAILNPNPIKTLFSPVFYKKKLSLLTHPFISNMYKHKHLINTPTHINAFTQRPSRHHQNKSPAFSITDLTAIYRNNQVLHNYKTEGINLSRFRARSRRFASTSQLHVGLSVLPRGFWVLAGSNFVN